MKKPEPHPPQIYTHTHTHTHTHRERERERETAGFHLRKTSENGNQSRVTESRGAAAWGWPQGGVGGIRTTGREGRLTNGNEKTGPDSGDGVAAVYTHQSLSDFTVYFYLFVYLFLSFCHFLGHSRGIWRFPG